METDIPEEIGCVFFGKEVFREGAGEVCELLLECGQRLGLCVHLNLLGEGAVHENVVSVELFQDLVKDLRIVLCELTVLELAVRDRLTVFLTSGLVFVVLTTLGNAVERFGVLDHHVEPQRWFDLFHNVRELASGNDFNGRIVA